MTIYHYLILTTLTSLLHAETYTYDALGRLIGSSTSSRSITYTYDAAGNLLNLQTSVVAVTAAPSSGGSAPATASVLYVKTLNDNADAIPSATATTAKLSPQLVIEPLGSEEGYALKLTFAVEAGKTYYVQVSTDLVTWSDYSPPLVASAASLIWLDRGYLAATQDPAYKGQRFYRVRMLP